MAGKVRQLIDELVQLRSRGTPALAHFVKAHLALKGIDPDAYDERSADDPAKIQVLEHVIHDFTQASRMNGKAR
jgi:hypothetical protein